MSAVHLRLQRSGRTLAVVDRPQAISITLDFDRVYTFDREGRLVSFFDVGSLYRRGLDGRLLHKARGPNRNWEVELLPPEHASSTYRTILAPIQDAYAELQSDSKLHTASRDHRDMTARALRLVACAASMDPDELARDAARFRQVYSPVAILPPDHYLSLVIQVTQGCSHNRCRFCSFYQDVPFRVKDVAELEAHMEEVVDFLGTGISLRQSLFLGDANALVIEPVRLLNYLERIRLRFTGDRAPAGFRPRGIYSFVDSFHTGFDDLRTWKELSRRGLSGVYLGVESGSDELLSAMNKPASGDAARTAISVLKRAGLQVGVILIAGLGGEPWDERHTSETRSLLEQLSLERRDLVYFSPYQEDQPRAAMTAFKPDLSAEGIARQQRTWRAALRNRPADMRPRTALYSLREFIY